MKTIHEYLNNCLEKWREEPYVYTKTDKGFISRTFNEIISDARALAAAIYNGNRDRFIYIFAENSAEWMICDLAVMGYAGICVPLDKEWTEFDLENVLLQSGSGILFYSHSQAEIVSKVKEKYIDFIFYSMEIDLPNLIKKGRDLPVPPPSGLEETVKIIFTSGTTARPKAIPLSQRNMFSNWDALYSRTPMTHADRSYIFLPLNHVYSGVANFLYTIISGMSIYLCRDLKEINQDVIAVKPTVICTVPIMLAAMHKLMTEELLDALKQVRFLYNGGSFTDPALKRWFIDRGVNVLEAYGTTETSSVIALSKISDGRPEETASVMESITVKIIDPDNSGTGEIIVGGEAVSSGYLNCPENHLYFDEDGYFHTGDLGRLDDSDHLFVLGRKKRMLDTPDGKNVYADEIENLLKENPMINAVKVYMENGQITASVFADLTAHTPKDVQDYVDDINLKLPKFKRILTLHITEDKLGGRIK